MLPSGGPAAASGPCLSRLRTPGGPAGESVQRSHSATQASNSAATILSPVTPSAAAEQSHTMGVAMTVAGSSSRRTSAVSSSGIIPVAVGPPGQQHVHADPGAGEVRLHDPREGLRAGPGRAIGDEAPPAHGGVVHGDVDDASPAGLEQMGDHSPRDQEVAGQVGGDHVREAAMADLPEGLRVGEEAGVDTAHAQPGVVHQDIEPAQPLQGLGDPPGHLILVADVHGQTDRAARAAGHRGGHLLDAGELAAGDRHGGSTPTRASAIARPMPLVAPVTRTRTPRRSAWSRPFVDITATL